MNSIKNIGHDFKKREEVPEDTQHLQTFYCDVKLRFEFDVDTIRFLSKNLSKTEKHPATLKCLKAVHSSH